jgi:hypothetical protein
MSTTEELSEIFESVTGTSVVTEEQDEDAAASADGDASESVEELSVEAVRNDDMAGADEDMTSGWAEV